LAPAEIRALLLRHADQPQERLTRVHVAPLGVADPDPEVDRVTERAVEPHAVAQGRLRALLGVDVDYRAHVAQKLAALGEARRAGADHPAVAARSVSHAELDAEARGRGRRREHGARVLEILGVDRVGPAEAQPELDVAPGERRPGLREERAVAVRLAHV